MPMQAWKRNSRALPEGLVRRWPGAGAIRRLFPPKRIRFSGAVKACAISKAHLDKFDPDLSRIWQISSTLKLAPSLLLFFGNSKDVRLSRLNRNVGIERPSF